LQKYIYYDRVIQPLPPFCVLIEVLTEQQHVVTPNFPKAALHHEASSRFATTFQVRLRERHSDEERKLTWYSSMDYATFGKDVKRTVKHIRKGRSFVGLSARGLEKYLLSQYQQEKKRRELNHYRSILMEHQRQRSEGKLNPIMLRMLSSISSNWAIHNALEFAKHDASRSVQMPSS
jgi:anthranilate/para-aminobenzoate synthase component I